VARGILFGLTAGLILGGFGLVAWGGYQVVGAVDCTGLSAEECALQRELALWLGRRQVMFGGALGLLGLALVLYLRSQAQAQRSEQESG
jgi:hypothetical protein